MTEFRRLLLPGHVYVKVKFLLITLVNSLSFIFDLNQKYKTKKLKITINLMSGGESAACCECERNGRSINRELNQTGR